MRAHKGVLVFLLTVLTHFVQPGAPIQVKTRTMKGLFASLPSSSRQLTTKSAWHCWLLASFDEDPVNIACYLNNICKLAWTDPTTARISQSNGWQCYKNQYYCYASDGSAMKLGDVAVHETCPTELESVCTLLGIRDRGKADVSAATTCTAPFQMVGSSCVHVIQQTYKYCPARKACMDLGADLAAPKSAEDTTTFVNHVRNTLGTNSVVWLDAIRTVTGFRYIRNGQLDRAVASSEWSPGEPQSTEKCVIIYGPASALYDTLCNTNRWPMCEIFL